MYSIFRCYKHPTEEDDMGPVIKESWRGRRQVIGTKILFLPDSINLLQCPSTCCSNTSYTSPKVHFTRVKVTLSDVLCWFWKGWHFCHLISHFRHLVSNFTMHGDRQRLFTTHLGFSTCVMETWICRNSKHNQWCHWDFCLQLSCMTHRNGYNFYHPVHTEQSIHVPA